MRRGFRHAVIGAVGIMAAALLVRAVAALEAVPPWSMTPQSYEVRLAPLHEPGARFVMEGRVLEGRNGKATRGLAGIIVV